MAIVFAVTAVVILALVTVMWRRRRGPGLTAETLPGMVAVEGERLRPAVAEFHVRDGAAMVHFDVPLPEGGADEVLSDLLAREAVEVVREKRHTLPIEDVHRVVALGCRGTEWVEAAVIGLDTPGELPPPVIPGLMLPHAVHHDFDPFEHFDELPERAPGLAAVPVGEDLEAMALRLPASASAGLRAMGVDPASVDPASTVLNLMRAAGFALSDTGGETYTAARAGQRTFIRVVPHQTGDHPELGESEIRKFVVDFGSSGAARGLLITEKYSPFEVYDRERRDPRMRFVTRERLQQFVDALALG